MRWIPADRGHVGMLEVVMHAIGDGAVVVEGGETALDRVDQIIRTLDVEVGLLLPGKRSIRQILGGGGGTHREQQGFPGLRAHQSMVVADARFQTCGQGSRQHPAANLAPGQGQSLRVVDIERGHPDCDPARQIVVREVFPEGVGGGGETAGDAHPLVG